MSSVVLRPKTVKVAVDNPVFPEHQVYESRWVLVDQNGNLIRGLIYADYEMLEKDLIALKQPFQTAMGFE